MYSANKKALTGARSRKKAAFVVFVSIATVGSIVAVILFGILKFDFLLVSDVEWPSDPVELLRDRELSSANGKHDLVLGMYAFPDVAVTADPNIFDGLKRFAATLRQTAKCNACVVIFMPRIPDGLAATLSTYGVTLLVYTPAFASRVGLYSFSSLRFTLYKMFLDRYSDLFSRVMTSDISDVVFQTNPFDAAMSKVFQPHGGSVSSHVHRMPFIAAALEETFIQPQGVNGYWVKKCFGAGTLAQMVGQRVSCSGTTVGDIHSMKAYIKEMDAQMRSSVFCAPQGMDQGVHNVILRLNPYFKTRTTFCPNDEGPFLTVDSLRVLHFNETNGDVLNGRGEVYSTLHQINRCKDFVTKFRSIDQISSEVRLHWQDSKLWGCSRLLNPPMGEKVVHTRRQWSSG